MTMALHRAMRNLSKNLVLRMACPSSIRRTSSFSLLSREESVKVAADVIEEEEEGEEIFSGGAVAVKGMAEPSLLQPRVVIYDGVCHLCHRGVKRVIKADIHRKIKFCCLQSKAADPYLKLCGLERQDVLKRFVFIEGLGRYHQASTAALKVLAYLPFPYSVLGGLLVVPAPIRDAIYDYIATHRYDWFGASNECLVVKERELLDRFIDRDEFLDMR